MVTQLFRSGSGSNGAPSPSSSSPAPVVPPVVRILACGGTFLPAPAKPMLRRVDVRTAVAAAMADQAGGEEADVVSRPAKSDLCAAAAGRSERDGENEEGEEEEEEEEEDDDARGGGEAAVKEAGIMTCVAISAAGARGRGILVTGSYDKGVRVLHNVLCPDRENPPSSSDEDGAAAAAAAPPPPVTMRMLGHHEEGVRAVAISADGRWAVTGDRKGLVKVWEVPREAPPGADREPSSSDGAAEAEFEAHKGYVYSLCMSPDARTVARTSRCRLPVLMCLLVFDVWMLWM
ncbi:unnamed protein product [Ectocarpus sp. 4 AP-2014]